MALLHEAVEPVLRRAWAERRERGSRGKAGAELAERNEADPPGEGNSPVHFAPERAVVEVGLAGEHAHRDRFAPARGVHEEHVAGRVRTHLLLVLSTPGQADVAQAVSFVLMSAIAVST